jgi:PAS domain S-box-containing protein
MNSLRSRIIIIVFLAVIPLAGLLIYNNLQYRQAATLNTQKNLMGVVKNSNSDYNNIIDQTKQFLLVLTEHPAVKNHESAASSELFKKVIKGYPLYYNIIATKRNGEIFASAHPLPPQRPHSLSDRIYFKRILKTKEFSLGELVFGRALGVATLPCASPIFDPSGQFQGVVAVGLNLHRLSRVFQITELPTGASFGIIDNRGRIMFQHPEPEKFIAKDLSHTEIVQTILAQKQGLVEARGLDGKQRLYAFVPLGGASQEGFVFSGIPIATIYSPVQKALIRNLLSLGLVTIFALILAWVLGYLFVMRRMGILTKATEKLAAGDLSARTGMHYGKGEIDLVGRAFDEMASTLQQREIERQQAEQDLRESEEKYRLLVNQIPGVVYKGYVDWNLDCFDEKIEEITGYSQEDFNSRRVTWRDLIFEEDLEPAKKLFLEAKKTNRFYVAEHRIKKKNGEVRWIQAWNRAICDATGKTAYISGVFFDITDRKALEDQLTQAKKMQAIGTLAGGIAHDFNNILGAILGFTELTLDAVSRDGQEYYNLTQVLKAGERARDLVQQILVFSRRSSQDKKPLQVSSIVEETLKLLRASLPATIDIQQNLTTQADLVLANPTQIQQILMNLASNAAHAMRINGGLLEVGLEEYYLDSVDLGKYPDLIPGPYVKLSVRDTGQGMDQEVMRRIFEPFFTTKEVGEGTGMGLPVVHGIVKSIGGEITVSSQPGAGTTFTILLPKVAGEVDLELVDSTPLPTGDNSILFIDDEEILVNMTKRMLKKLGYKVVAKTSSSEALEIFRAHPEKFDLIITDQTMPDLTGMQLARELRSVRPDIPIILCTGYSENVSEEKIKAAGINDLLMKPVVMRKLAETIRQVLD